MPLQDTARALTHRAANRMLAPVERFVAASPPPRLDDPPIFILGPPRCGSTVLFQLLARRFDMAYFTNAHCRWFGLPVFAETRRPTADRAPAGFHSEYGQTEGPDGPSECGEYWYRFFPRNTHLVESLSSEKERALRRSLGGLVVAAQRPFLIKNLMCTMRLPAIAKVFPEALFIVVHRSELETGHSILEGRWRNQGDYSRWWSLQVPGHESLRDAPPEVQVVEQIRRTYGFIDEQRQALGGERFIDVSYADLCSDTRATLTSVAERLASLGVTAAVRGDVPATLAKREGVRIDLALYRRLLQVVRPDE